MNKIKSLCTKVKNKSRYLAAFMAVSAVSAISSICACAEETTGTTTSDMQSIITSAGDTLKEEFTLLVQTMVPLLVSIGVVGLSVFAIVSLFNMAKKFFKKAAG